MWIENQCNDGKLPAEYKQCLPQQIKQTAMEKFQEHDSSLYPEIQTDIAKHLLMLRVTFRENERIGKKYRADIKLLNQNTLIIL